MPCWQLGGWGGDTEMVQASSLQNRAFLFWKEEALSQPLWPTGEEHFIQYRQTHTPITAESRQCWPENWGSPGRGHPCLLALLYDVGKGFTSLISAPLAVHRSEKMFTEHLLYEVPTPKWGKGTNC